tara:strand:- start:4189 stop:6048 length:1860 start_codon:yes stop_codon:yes gene_type:complete
MANTSISISSIVITSVISVSVAVSSVSATATFPDASIGVSVTGQTINASYLIVPTTVLPEQQVGVSDGEDEVQLEAKLTKDIDAVTNDEALPSEAINKFDVELVKTDSVTMVESRVKVFTDFIDFDPTDDDVDATPVTIDESAAFDLSKSFTGADDVTPSESTAKSPNKPGITASVSTSEAINQLRPHKNVTDTATTSEAIDRFDVTTELTDTVSVTEETAKSFTVADPNDSVTAVQSNIKAFTSNIDFDLSDADVDPDPVTATDQINIFAATKGLTDTASVVEATAKTVGNNSLADTASPAEAAVFNTTKPAIADTLTAVEGIKLEPTVQFTPATSGAQTFVITVVSSGGNKFAIDGVTNPVLELASGVTYTFDVSDSSVSGHPLRFKDGSTSYTDGVTVSGTAGQSGATVTFTVPNDAPTSTLLYYCTVHGNAMGNSISVPNSLTANQVLAVEAAVFSMQSVFAHSASVTESINTSLILGESDFAYPSQVYMHDTDSNNSSIRGYHRGLGEAGVAFVQDVYRHRITDFTGILGQDDSLLNSAVILDSAVDGDGRDEFVGILGSAGLINQPRINGQSITYAETSSAGLLVNFIYTDTDDTELGGHFLNETPLCAGRHI